MTAPTATPMVLLPVPLDDLVDAIVERVAERTGAKEPAPHVGRLSTAKLAEALGVSRAKVHELAENKTLPFVWVGDHRKFDLAECLAALKSQPAPARKRSGPGRGKRA
jgi:excisionase family DNA binding protein